MARKRIDLPFDDDSGTAAFLVRTAQLQGKCARKSAFTGTRGRFRSSDIGSNWAGFLSGSATDA